MEEAYNQLYQQFLSLRSLCLKQAALLHQLTTALQKQQGAPVPIGEVSDLISIPVRCSHELPPSLHEKSQLLKAAEQCRVDHPYRKVGSVSSLLAEDMSKLSMDTPSQVFMLTSDPSRYLGASSIKLKSDENPPVEDKAQRTARMPMTGCSYQVDDLLNQAGAAMMSDVVLHSHVCEFCQAVFPGDSTTSGEFLRHLHTHIT
uniref:TRAF family member-associated NFKB activator n=1 Tax=Nothobranchius kadleci TaxID=1051664 RepID=A0A1A8DWL7_NOTKA